MGNKLAARHANAGTKHESCVRRDKQVNSMAILSPDNAEVENIIMGLPTDYAAGWDGISSKLLKLSSQTLVPLVTHICDICFSQGEFPRVLKRAVVHPIQK